MHSMTSLGPQGSNLPSKFSLDPHYENDAAFTKEAISNLAAKGDKHSNPPAKGGVGSHQLGYEANDNPDGCSIPANGVNIPRHRMGLCSAPKRPNSIPIQFHLEHSRDEAGWPNTESPPKIPNEQEFPDLVSPLSPVGSIQYLPLVTLENELDRVIQDSLNDDDDDDNDAENNDKEKAPWQPKLKRKKPATGKLLIIYTYFGLTLLLHYNFNYVVYK